MKNEKVYKTMSGTEVGAKLEKMMDLVDDMVLDAGKYTSDIQRMATNYKEYIAEYHQGGDWTVEEFMASIAKKAMIANDILGIENDDK